jgi:hypothetical protein
VSSSVNSAPAQADGVPEAKRPVSRSPVPLVVAVIVGVLAGGWISRATDPASPSSADRDTVILHTAPIVPQGSFHVGASQTPIPVELANDGPMAVTVTAAVLNWPTGAQPQRFAEVRIGASTTAPVPIAAPDTMSALCRAAVMGSKTVTEHVITATFTVVAASGRTHDVTLPVAAWESYTCEPDPYGYSDLATLGKQVS